MFLYIKILSLLHVFFPHPQTSKNPSSHVEWSSVYLQSSCWQLYSVNCNTPLKKEMPNKDFKDSLRYDPLKSVTIFLFILLHTGSYPMCIVNLKSSATMPRYFLQVNVQPGSGGVLSKKVWTCFLDFYVVCKNPDRAKRYCITWLLL